MKASRTILSIFILLAHSYALAKPLTLDQAVSIAVEKSPEAQTAYAKHKLALAIAERERPVGAPTLLLIATAGAQGDQRRLDIAGTSLLFQPTQQGKIGLQLEQQLYRAGAGAAWSRYAAIVQSENLKYELELQQLYQKVSLAYFGVVKATIAVTDAVSGLVTANRLHSLVQAQIKAGFAKPIDENQSEAHRLVTEGGVSLAKSMLAQAQMNLNRLLGRELGAKFEIPTLVNRDSELQDLETAVTHALSQRLELRLLRSAKQESTAGIELARSQLAPTLALKAELAEQTQTAIFPGSYYGMLLEVRWSLLDGGKRRKDVHEAVLGKESLEAQYREAELGIELEVRTAYSKAKEKVAASALALRIESAQRMVYEVAVRAYELNQTSIREVIEAGRQLRDATAASRDALYEKDAARIEFLQAGSLMPDTRLPGRRPW